MGNILKKVQINKQIVTTAEQLQSERLSQDQCWIFYLGLVMALQLNEIES